MSDQPKPFSIARIEGAPAVATNGTVSLVCPDLGGEVRLRRGIRGALAGPLAERVLPALNVLAGEMLGGMDPLEVEARLAALQLLCRSEPPQSVEWAYAELDGVRAYTDGRSIVLTRQDLTI